MKTYVLYHGGCPDGTTAAAIARLYFEGDPPVEPIRDTIFVPCYYGRPIPEIEVGSTVYMLDFSLPRAQLIALNELTQGNLRVIDHHKTAQADCDGLHYCTFDLDHSGAFLAWMYFFPRIDVPKFVRYIEDRDLWKFELRGSRRFSACRQTYPLDVPEMFAEFIMNRGTVSRFISEGGVALRQINCSVDAMCKQVRTAIFDLTGAPQIIFDSTRALVDGQRAWFVPVVNASVFFSEVGERLLKMYPDAKFSAYYFDRADKRQWGLRSRPGFDCSEIAKAYGGGGHPASAGFVTK